MSSEFKISYEMVGASSYMAATLSPEAQLVHYQMEMMVENRMKNLLPAFKRVKNGEIVLYYNITSRIPLNQVLEKRKLKRDEFIHLVEGAIYAIRDMADYRLPETGLLMMPEYIYVNPSTCDPNFVFMPIVSQNSRNLKELIQDLVLRGQMELTQDNFVQSILEVLNERTFSLDHLEECMKKFRMGANVSPKPVYEKFVPVQPAAKQPTMVHQETIPQPPVQPSPVPVSRPVREEKPEKRIKSGTVKSEMQTEGGFDPEKAKKKFLLPQAVIMIAVSAGISFGLFVDKTGAPAVKNILAAVIVLVMTEIIIYREAYVNSRKKSGGDKPGQAASKTIKKTEKKHLEKKLALKGKKTGRPAVPAPGVQTAEAQASAVHLAAEPVLQQTENPYREENRPEFRPINDFVSAVIPRQDYGQEETDLGDETELWGGDAMHGGSYSYLEYYENENAIRIPLNHPNGVVIGRLRSQADFIVTNARVGKVHAKFYEQNGQYYVVDINSKNGTFINGREQRIQSNIPYPLQDNDRIMLADSEFVIRCPQR